MLFWIEGGCYLPVVSRKKNVLVFFFGGRINLVVKWLFCTLTILLSAVVRSNEVKVETLDSQILWL